MQKPDEKKRQLISNIAARLFATRPFHKVRLDDVAAQANVGKGTLYIYFKSKEELYFSLIFDGFSALVDDLETQLDCCEGNPRQTLRAIVSRLVHFSFQHPHFYELIRTAPIIKNSKLWEAKRRSLSALIEKTIRDGIESGDFNDPQPFVTAACIPGLVRSIMLFGPGDLTEEGVSQHIIHMVEKGIGAPDAKRSKKPKPKVNRNAKSA